MCTRSSEFQLTTTRLAMFLVVGHCCVDDIYHVIKYPEEDSTVGCNTTHNRCSKQSWTRGGNASNSSTVLREFGVAVEYFGTLANDHLLQFFFNDFKSAGIQCDNCPTFDNVQSPASVVLCSEDTGSRTIVHHNGGLPELTLEHFKQKINLANYKWIHFEGRNMPELTKILNYVKEFNESCVGCEKVADTDGPIYLKRALPISVEVEKTREILGELLPLADVAFLGKDFAVMKGAKNCTEAVEMFSKVLPKGIVIICAWGDQGASFGVAGDGKAQHVPAVPPPGKIVDSLGAGDTFLSAVIYALNQKWDVHRSVQFGCKIASAKLTLYGYKGISEFMEEGSKD